MIATAHAAHQTLAIPRAASRPYVASMGTPALRFMERLPIAPILSKPIASGPPVAASAPEVAEVNLANNEAAASTPPMSATPAQPAPSVPASEHATPKPEQPATQAPKPQPIIPDDTRRKLQSQDFLPLFRFPGPNGSSEDVTVVVPSVPTPPAPGTLPPSSATYQQR